MNTNPKKFKEFLTSTCAAALLGVAVLATQTDIISAQASNFQGARHRSLKGLMMRDTSAYFSLPGYAHHGTVTPGGNC